MKETNVPIQQYIKETELSVLIYILCLWADGYDHQKTPAVISRSLTVIRKSHWRGFRGFRQYGTHLKNEERKIFKMIKLNFRLAKKIIYIIFLVNIIITKSLKRQKFCTFSDQYPMFSYYKSVLDKKILGKKIF